MQHFKKNKIDHSEFYWLQKMHLDIQACEKIQSDREYFISWATQIKKTIAEKKVKQISVPLPRFMIDEKSITPNMLKNKFNSLWNFQIESWCKSNNWKIQIKTNQDDLNSTHTVYFLRQEIT
jgi:predicted nucleotidyltransferase